MTGDINLGDNYQIDEDSNGDLVILDGNGSTVIKHDHSASEWSFEQTVTAQSPAQSNELAIKDYVDSVAQGLDWQDSVINELNDPPASPSTGDRYLIDDNPTGDWVGHPNEIAEWDGSQWLFFAPNEGWAVFVEDVDLLNVYDDTQSDWIAFGSAIDHGALAGLTDDDHTQYLLVDGTRAMSGGLDMGGNTISNASSVSTGEVTINDIGARLAKDSNQAISSGQFETVTFETIDYDDDPGFLSFDLNNNQFTVDADGTYLINARVTQSATGQTGYRLILSVDVNGAEVTRSDIAISQDDILGTNVAFVQPLSQGDNVTLQVFQDSGGSLNLRSSLEDTFFSVSRLG